MDICVKKCWFEILQKTDHSHDLGVERRMIFKCVLEKCVWRLWIGSIWIRIGTGGGL